MFNDIYKEKHYGFTDKEAKRLDRESERYEKRFERAELKRDRKRDKELKSDWL